VWALGHQAVAAPDDPLSPAAERKLHQTVKKVTVDTETLSYNTAIAALMEYVNTLRETGDASRAAVEPLVLLLAPYAPHIAEELWQRLGHGESVFRARWPAHEERLIQTEAVEV